MPPSHRCQRDGCAHLVSYAGRGRPPRWCSDECRRRAHESGIRIKEIATERVVTRTERISAERRIAQILDSSDDTELLLRAIAHRWQQSGLPAGATDRARFSPHLTRIWDAFHTGGGGGKAPATPPKLPTAAAERRAAVELVLSSPRSIGSVITQIARRLESKELTESSANAPVFNAVYDLLHVMNRARRAALSGTRRG